jgi:hypothetical protein
MPIRTGTSMRIDLEPGPKTGLRAPSQVVVDCPQTIRLSDMGQAIGQLDLATIRVTTRQISVVLGIGTGRPRRTPVAGT